MEILKGGNLQLNIISKFRNKLLLLIAVVFLFGLLSNIFAQKKNDDKLLIAESNCEKKVAALLKYVAATAKKTSDKVQIYEHNGTEKKRRHTAFKSFLDFFKSQGIETKGYFVNTPFTLAAAEEETIDKDYDRIEFQVGNKTIGIYVLSKNKKPSNKKECSLSLDSKN